MPTFAQLDAITLADLQATGATKYSAEEGAIGVFTAEMDYGVACPIVGALRGFVDTELFGYTPPHFITDLQAATSQFLGRRYGWHCPPERIFPVGDVLVALDMTMKHFANGSQKVIVPTPAYMPFVGIPQYFGFETIEVPMLLGEDGQYRYDLDGIDQAFKAGAGLLIHCDPHNPTGRIFSRDELLAVEEVVTRNQGRVFADSIWAPLVSADKQHIPYASISEAAANHTITATSASKAWNLPGLKTAQLITSNQADTDLWNEVGVLAMHGASTAGMVANAAAYRDGVDWLDDIVAYLRRNATDFHTFVAENLPDVAMPMPEGTYVAWLDLNAYDLQPTPAAYLLEHAGVLLTDGTKCGQIGQGFARFIFAMPHPLMIEALGKIAEALAGAPRRPSV